MQSIFIACLLTATVLMFSCQDGKEKSDSGTAKSDTVYTGLEGTRDQPGQLGTDVKADTSSGQSTTGMISGKDSSSTASSSDDEFIKDQVAGNYNEIGLAKLASKKASAKELKQIADYLVSDHSKALDKLKKMATAKKLSVATAASDDANNTISSLENKTAGDFDKAWCETLIDKHKSTIDKYESAAKSVTDAQLKSFVKETLPKLRMHLDKLMAYHGKIKT